MDFGKNTRLFTIFVVILTTASFVFGIVNSVYYSKLAERPSAAVSHGSATALLWFNVLLTVFAVAIFLWAMYRIFKSDSMNRQVHARNLNRQNKQAPRQNQGYQQPMAQPQQPMAQPQQIQRQQPQNYDPMARSQPIPIQQPGQQYQYFGDNAPRPQQASHQTEQRQNFNNLGFPSDPLNGGAQQNYGTGQNTGGQQFGGHSQSEQASRSNFRTLQLPSDPSASSNVKTVQFQDHTSAGGSDHVYV